jgi:hypothetical protein
MTLRIKLSVLAIYSRIIFIRTYIFEGLLLHNNLERIESAAPTSQVYASSTVIKMIMKYHILWRYVALLWHNIPTKNRDYQWSSSRFDVHRYATNYVTTCHLCRQIFPSYVGNSIILCTKHEKVFKIRGNNYRTIIDLIIECICFSHVVGLAALSLWPEYPVLNNEPT